MIGDARDCFLLDPVSEFWVQFASFSGGEGPLAYGRPESPHKPVSSGSRHLGNRLDAPFFRVVLQHSCIAPLLSMPEWLLGVPLDTAMSELFCGNIPPCQSKENTISHKKPLTDPNHPVQAD